MAGRSLERVRKRQSPSDDDAELLGGDESAVRDDADDSEEAPVDEEQPVTREELRRFRAESSGLNTPMQALPAPSRAPWLHGTHERGVYAGESGIRDLPGDGGDVVLPVGSGGQVLKPPLKDFDAWMAKYEPLLVEYPGLYRVEVYRTSPGTTPEGTYCEGVCGRFNHAIDTEFVRERFGGHKYEVRIQGPAKNEQGETINKMTYLFAFRGLKIAGPPIIELQADAGLLKSSADDTRTVAERRRANAADAARAEAKAAEEAARKSSREAQPPPPTLESRLADRLMQESLDRAGRLEEEAKSMRDQLMQQGQVQPAPAPRDDGPARMLMEQNSHLQQTLIDILRERPEMQSLIPPPDNTKDALLVEAFRALASVKNQPAPIAQAPSSDPKELDRLHALVSSLQDDVRKLNEERRREMEDLTKRFRDETDSLRKQYDRQIDDTRVAHRDEMSDLRGESRTQAETQIALVRQQYESLLTTVRNADEERIRILQTQLEDYRSQNNTAQSRISAAEATAQQARLDEIAAKTKAEIAAVNAASRPRGEDGLSSVVKTVREMRDAMEIISPGAAAAAAAPAEVAKPGVTDRVLGIAETIAKSEKGADLLKLVLDRWDRRQQAQQQQQPAAQQPAQQQPAQPTTQQMDEAQRAWAVEQQRQREAEQARREAARAQRQPTHYEVSGGARFETLEAEPEPVSEELPPQQPQQQAVAPAPPPDEPTDEEIAAAMLPTIEGTLAAIEEAALADTPPEQCVDSILKSTMGMSREEAMGLFEGIDPRKALAEIGITREQLSMAGGLYFDRVTDYMAQTLNVLKPA
jgi:hypothetical protein